MNTRLISMEITGFKSFKDKQIITFHPNLTAIVGPNGCGKSNILEALVWSLGESHVSSLRLERKEDILFSLGESESYFAEVSLLLDKNEPQEKLVASRRYYSNGKSSYFINQEEVKLGFYQEVLSSWGFSSDSYSFLPQGSLSLFFSKGANSSLQEALYQVAGIHEWEQKKEKILNNINRTKEILDSSQREWQESLAEQERLSSFLLQKERALKVKEEFDSLNSEMILIEMYQLYLRIEENKDKVNSISSHNNAREGEALQMQLTLTRERLKDSKEDFQESEKEILKSKNIIDILEKESIGLSSEFKIANDQLNSILKRIEDIELEKEKASRDLKSQSSFLNELLFKQDELKERKLIVENKIRRLLYNISRSIPKGIQGEILKREESNKKIQQFIEFNDNIMLNFIHEYFKEEEVFLKSLNGINWDELDINFKDLYEDFVLIDKTLEDQQEKVLQFRANRSKEESDFLSLEREIRELREEEVFYKNRCEILSLRIKSQEEKLVTQNDLFSHWQKKNSIFKKEIDRLNRLFSNLENNIRQEGRSNSQELLGEDLKRSYYDWNSQFLALKRSLLREEDWVLFLKEKASPNLLENLESFRLEYEKIKKEFMDLRMWLSSDLKETEYKESALKLERLSYEREDIRKSLEESQKILKDLEKQKKRHFDNLLNNLNRDLKESSLKYLKKGFLQIEKESSFITFIFYQKGEKKKTLKSFSGGEKTITYLCFLIALYQIKPVPLTFLDEVDSALDDYNAKEWVNVLKEVSLSYPIALITHNSVVASSANQIIGITSSENKSTQVYSLDLEANSKFL